MDSISVSEGVQIASGSYTGKMEAPSTIGCFATPTPLVDHGSYTFQSSGNCQKVCYQLQQPVMGLTSGTNCSCGSLLPPKDSQVDDSKCNTKCSGYDLDFCGGGGYWWVILTGWSQNEIDNLNPKSMKSHTTLVDHPASVVTIGGSTVISTVAPTTEAVDSSASPKKTNTGGGSNTVGIAVGVVVGVLVLAAVIGAVLLVLRRRKRRMEAEEYQQKQTVQQFVAGGKGGAGYTAGSETSMNDTRLDPDFMMSRRQSDGSIMDNQDYSRRILKVTNPTA